MRAAVLILLLVILAVAGWRATSPSQRSAAWRAGRPYLAALLLGACVLYTLAVLALNAGSVKFL